METTQQDIDRTFHHDAAGVHGIHTARKEGPCQFGRRVDGGERCANRIKPGDKYVAGDFDMHAGPWAQTRWCMHCVEFAIDAANATATAATNARLQDVA